MISRINLIFERIEQINSQFKGMAPRKTRREKQTFASALTEIQNQPIAPAKNQEPSKEPGNLVASHVETKPSPVETNLFPFSDSVNRQAQKYGLEPELLRKMIELESGFNHLAVSSKGARGLMQLMPGTVKDMGVKNPFDPDENIAGGAKYLSKLLKRYGGDVKQALAAYNAGPSAVSKYGGVPPYSETERYVERILRGVNLSDPESDD